MLKGIDPLLSPDLLASLRAMGHGDEIAIVDGNYPALEHARRLIRLDGHGIVAVVNAILSLLPIDDFVAEAIFRSTVGADAERLDPIHQQGIGVGQGNRCKYQAAGGEGDSCEAAHGGSRTVDSG